MVTVVRIDLHQPVQRVARSLDVALFQVEIEQPHQHAEVFCLAVDLVVVPPREFVQRNRVLSRPEQALERGLERFLFLGRRGDGPDFLERFHRRGFLAAINLPQRDLEQLLVVLARGPRQGLERGKRPIELPGFELRASQQELQVRVARAGRERIQQLHCALRLALAQQAVGIDQRDAAIVRQNPVRALQDGKRRLHVVQPQRELPGAQIAARRRFHLPQALGHLPDQEVPPRIVRVEHGDALPARERLRRALLEQVQLCRVFKLFDGLHRAVLLLQQVCVTRHALGRLRRGLQEPAVERHGLGGIAGFHEAVELQTIEMRRALGIVLPGVQVSQRLHGVEVGRIGAEDFQVGLDGVIELALLDALLRPGEQFFEVDTHPTSSAARGAASRSLGTWLHACADAQTANYIPRIRPVQVARAILPVRLW